MKISVLTTIFAICLISTMHAQWELRYPELPEDKITDVAFISESTGFFVNEAGAIYRTTDGGEEWKEAFYDGNSEFTSIQFINDQVGFAYAYIGSCFTYTTDGGKSWQQDDLYVHMARSVVGFSRSEFLKTDENGIYKTTSVFGDWQKIYDVPIETIDGGDLFWEETIAIPKKTQQFSDSSLSILYYNRYRGDYQNKQDSLYYLLSSDNRGERWDSTWINIKGKIASLEMVDPKTGFLLTESGSFFKTDNFGKSWERKRIPNTDVAPHNIVPFSKDRVYLKGRKVFKTTDGGDHWDIIQVPQNGFNTGYVISRYDHTAFHDLQLKISADGEEWMHGKQFQRISGSKLYFKNKTTGWAFGQREAFITKDGGYTWEADTTFPDRPYEIKFINEEEGWFIGKEKIYKTEDGGRSWALLDLLASGENLYGPKILFDNKFGIIYANFNCEDLTCGKLLVTNDNGATWDNRQVPTSFKSLSLAKGKIFAVDGQKQLWVSNDKGISWEVCYDYSYENLWPKPLVRAVGDQVWLHIGFRNLAYSKDGGESWHITSKVGHQLTADMVLLGPYHDGSADLLMVDEFGTIQNIDSDLGTYDKKYETPPTRTHLEHITYTMDDNRPLIWIMGTYNTVLFRKVWNGIDVSNALETTEIPRSNALHQNYPNPFNPSTTFSFDLKKTGHVKLSVFDITGREVAVIQDNRLAAGSHSILFNAEGLASGTYFYRLKTKDQVLSKKFTLIK
ncbi:YCF48-related protein [Gracilimonas mengyeensis]|uniref:Por secretion system C-terminal sorting domain-containing protein n=1 Tax=Gracilimonas mengyeensis TaxID=1302730 RepID=A0A521CKQ9_9BACT|nr:YCF48-related protein [Gracilimonas mengyeensis]SMO59270.1 Por secretion system C-terminal sorting domain-containing protein [Gracilimonas mengyeensis]